MPNVLIIFLRLANYRLFRCNAPIVILELANYILHRLTYWLNCYFLENYRLCRCNVLIVILMLVKCRFVDVVSRLKCYCLQVVGCVGVGLWLECYFLLTIGCVVCCLVIGILLLESFRLCRCNTLTSMRCYYSSLTFEVEEVWCTDSTGTSDWASLEKQKFSCWWLCQDVQE